MRKFIRFLTWFTAVSLLDNLSIHLAIQYPKWGLDIHGPVFVATLWVGAHLARTCDGIWIGGDVRNG
jgi:hypothetical protein